MAAGNRPEDLLQRGFVPTGGAALSAGNGFLRYPVFTFQVIGCTFLEACASVYLLCLVPSLADI